MQTASLPPSWDEFPAAAVVDEGGTIEALRRWAGCLASGSRPDTFLCLVGPMSSGKSLLAGMIRGLLGEGESILTSKPTKVREAIAESANREDGRVPRLVVIDHMPHDNEIAAVRLATLRNDGCLTVRLAGPGGDRLVTHDAPAFVLMYQADSDFVVPGTVARRSTIVRLREIRNSRTGSKWRERFSQLGCVRLEGLNPRSGQ